ncbi:MAG TPA: hypothetical protein VMH81_05985 [Bryobacteraceae bacterium]|nr:hypothetical protein [Bryobacteraceae bacterium]
MSANATLQDRLSAFIDRFGVFLTLLQIVACVAATGFGYHIGESVGTVIKHSQFL